MPTPDLASLLLTCTSLVTLLLGTRLVVGAVLRLPAGSHVSAKALGILWIALSCGLPKLAINLQALSAGSPDTAISNVLGSNLFNLLVVLGIVALLIPLRVPKQLLKRDLPMLLAAILLSYWLVLDHQLSNLDGLLLLSLGVVYALLLQRSKANSSAPLQLNTAPVSWWGLTRTLARLCVGGVLVSLAALGLIEGGLTLASSLGLSDRVAGLTVVAICACIPELLCALYAAIRQRPGFALAVVLGSNLFSLLVVLSVSTWVANGQLAISPNSLEDDWPALLAVALLCLPLFYSDRRIGRVAGALMLLGYAGINAHLLLFNLGRPEATRLENFTQHYALPAILIALALNQLFRIWRKRHASKTPD